MKRSVQRFEVSLKAFIVQEGRLLLLREADTGYWELPGGRIDVGEEADPHAQVLEREIGEELGPDFRISVGPEAVTWVRRRAIDGVFTFLVGRVCQVAGGVARLSPEHDGHVWALPGEWRRLGFPPESGYAAALEQLWALAATSPAGPKA